MPHEIHDKITLADQYKELTPAFERILELMSARIQDTLNLESRPTYKFRVKSFDNYYKKLLKVKTQGQTLSFIRDFPLTTDLVGIRVICVFLDDIYATVEQLKQSFAVVEVEQKGSTDFSQFSYESIHLLIKTPEDLIMNALAGFPELLPALEDFGKILTEVQVRTILQDAWAEAEHDLFYKSDFNPFDLPMRRKLASINASLSLADTLFQEIRDYQRKLHTEMDVRRRSFYDKADGMTKASSLNIDDYILEAIEAHNKGDFDHAIAIYSAILDHRPSPNDIVLSVIYKHRGMAYFAQNAFDIALQDFERSLEKNPRNAQSHYYAGIVKSLQGRHAEALDCFKKSLEISPFQGHTSFRKALAEYELGDYDAALHSLDAARKLGFDNEDTQKLRNKLLLIRGKGAQSAAS
jgi:ppGpp synthetase/RelA/SpoT-type nucleotidyltranferase